MEKRTKKQIVNSLTLSRIVGTVLMPFLVSTLSASMFLAVIGLILFTDCLDGFLARRWDVSTLFGSLADMTADKAFGFAILIVLTTMFPIMAIPLTLEAVISAINIKSVSNGSVGKSSELGRIKTWVMGLSICSLLLVGLSPELTSTLSNIKCIDVENSILSHLGTFGKEVGEFSNNLVTGYKDILTNILNKVNLNKDTIKNVAITGTIISEGLVATDYAIKSIKKVDKDSKKFKIAELKKNKDFIKQILFDEKYYKVTKDMPLKDKLMPTEEQKENIKKLILELDDKNLNNA